MNFLNGEYVVYFAPSNLLNKEEVGRFVLENGTVKEVQGDLVRTLLPIGPLNAVSKLRINHTFNNGYYFTERAA